MAELWELICHHNYKGVPGVIFDRSALGASHGRAWGLDDSDFLANGVAPDSGCVSFLKGEGYINVPRYHAAWNSLAGVRTEATLKLEDATGYEVILSSNAFRFFFRKAHPYEGRVILCSVFHTAPNAWRHYDTYLNSTMTTFTGVDYGNSAAPGQVPGLRESPVVSYPFPIPLGRWITVGFLYDGFNTVEIYVNGEKAADAHYAFTPLHPMDYQGLNIGAGSAGHSPFSGQIDEVKIWRLNPRRFTEDFFSRPMDGKTAECWKRFQRQIEEAFRRHPDCAEHLIPLFKKLLDSLLLDVIGKGPETKARLESAAHQYNTLWRAGKISGPEMRKVFADLITWFRLAGMDPAENPWLQRLISSECFTQILSELMPPDCDKQAVKLLESIVASLGGSVSRKSGGAD